MNSHCGILFNWLFCQVPVSHFSGPLCEIAKSTLFIGDLAIFPSGLYLSAHSTLPSFWNIHCQTVKSKLPCPHSKLPTPLHLNSGWTAWMSLKLPTEFKILDCPRPQFFWSAENFCPCLLKKDFPWAAYTSTPATPLPFLLSPFNLFLLHGSLKLERSPFKLQTIL